MQSPHGGDRTLAHRSFDGALAHSQQWQPYDMGTVVQVEGGKELILTLPAHANYRRRTLLAPQGMPHLSQVASWTHDLIKHLCGLVAIAFHGDDRGCAGIGIDGRFEVRIKSES